MPKIIVLANGFAKRTQKHILKKLRLQEAITDVKH